METNNKKDKGEATKTLIQKIDEMLTMMGVSPKWTKIITSALGVLAIIYFVFFNASCSNFAGDVSYSHPEYGTVTIHGARPVVVVEKGK